jgi:sporulation protein YlmC with PRC-barrel domain
MRAISIAAVSALALLTASAQAQQSPATSPSTPRLGATATAPSTTKVTMQNPLKQEDVSKIDGTSVLGSDSKKVGAVSNVLMQPEDKKIDRLVVHVGGVLGMGGRHVAIPVNEFSWDARQGAFKISKTANQLDKMAEWKQPSEGSTASGSSKSSNPPSQAGK